ncbi:aldehyde dehydrogenase family protein [Sodalis ligni]|uniref:Aldehyde dehydrogenase (NAD+) n=1 Tax=Sodalis ligni TaxID=2697027 RepID=A0A4V2Q2N3_9GAMM|nr:aldehyde dehydrogenase family protein [Sodalis ligni]TCL03518.1 aldehyde dehydrogenase (NAD+) [Sodalis ligni]
MKTVNQVYINGRFVTPHGEELFDLYNPATKTVIGRVRLADEVDAQTAIAAAKAAYPEFRQTTKAERMDYLQRLHDAVAAKTAELVDRMVEEYGAPRSMSSGTVARAAEAFRLAKVLLETFEFEKQAGAARVVLEPLGVVGLITPWNANYSFICSKLAMVIASGSTAVIKPSEMSALQTQLLTECLHEAGLPSGVFNIVTGRGDTVGTEIVRHQDIAKISFTGSTRVGKRIAREAVETMKRVTLELGGKSPNVILEDADLEKAIPLALSAVSINSGQACIAGSRLLVPERLLDEVIRLIKRHSADLTVGDPRQKSTRIGPLVSQIQYDRVQGYIRSGIAQGAELIVGGEGHPEGLEQGYFVRPTVFARVTPEMTIAREEIFGPVLSVLTYKSETQAIEMANDTVYGLQAYVSGTDLQRARRVAEQLVAGRVFINGLYDLPQAPFGGFKQSGIGREFGTYGLEEYLEPKTIAGHESS